jgi:uncharacterized membrane protein HdeD (DUF308 family)
MNEITDNVRSAGRAGTIWGIIVIILGMMAIAMPFVTGVAVTMTIGVILLATGVAQALYAFRSPSFGAGVLRFVFSLLAILAGLSLITQPAAGLATLTIFLAAWFFVDGVWSLIAGFRWRPQQGWGWMVTSGIVSIILGVMIYRQFPESAMWLVGVLVGIRLLFSGMAMIMMGSVTKAVANKVDEAISE